MNERGFDMNTILGEGSQYDGTLVVRGSLRVDGEFKGAITADSIVIGKNARVTANISSQQVVIGGHLEGNISSAKNIKLQNTSKVIGDVETERLSIEEGATLQGRCTMKIK